MFTWDGEAVRRCRAAGPPSLVARLLQASARCRAHTGCTVIAEVQPVRPESRPPDHACRRATMRCRRHPRRAPE
jgi:hypothetical protein